MTLEGLIIHKAIYKERDLICRVLLRDGSSASVYFYGGRGGGKFSKGTILEIGFMIKVHPQLRTKKGDPDIIIAKNWELIWNSKNIRDDYKAFYFSSFIFEFVSKISVKYSTESEASDQGLFKVVSNSLYYLDEALKNKDYHLNRHLYLFLVKITVELGVVPDLKNCLYCHLPLASFDRLIFEPQNGGFCCNECNTLISQEEGESSKSLLENTQSALGKSFKEWQQVSKVERGASEAIFKFLCFQFQWQPSSFISYSMLH